MRLSASAHLARSGRESRHQSRRRFPGCVLGFAREKGGTDEVDAGDKEILTRECPEMRPRREEEGDAIKSGPARLVALNRITGTRRKKCA